MKFVSIDLETTGLDPSLCEIVELGAVFDDLSLPFDYDRLTASVFHTYVKPGNSTSRPGSGQYTGEPYALSMHAEIFRRIAKEEQPYTYTHPEHLVDDLGNWIYGSAYGLQKGVKILWAGKNVQGFDLPFLRKTGAPFHLNTHHRVVDPGCMYALPSDECPPDLKTCCKRAYQKVTEFADHGDHFKEDAERMKWAAETFFNKPIAHTAVEDAMQVVMLIRAHYGLL